MKKLLFIGLILSFFIVQVFSASYELEIFLLPDSKSVKGIATITLNNDEQPHFVLNPNFEKDDNPKLHSIFEGRGQTKIDILNVTDINGNNLNFKITDFPSNILYSKHSTKEGLLIVDTNKKVIKIEFVTYFNNQLSQDNYAGKDLFVWRFGWYPQLIDYNSPNALTPHEWKLIPYAPEGWVFVGEKSLLGSFYQSNGYYVSCPLVFVHTDTYRSYTLNGNNIDTTIWFKDGLNHRASSMLTYTQKALELHSNKFGDLRYSHINILHSPFPGNMGMAADGLFILSDGFFTTADLILPGALDPLTFYIISHETAHFWFGIGTPVDFATDNFISESLADYAAHTSMFELYGNDNVLNTKLPDIFVSMLTQNMNTFRIMDQSAIFDSYYSGVKGSPSANYDEVPINYISTFHYNVGKRSVFQLADYIGKETLNNLLKDFYFNSKGKIVNENDFFEILSLHVEEEIIYNLFKNPEPFDANVRILDWNTLIVELNKNVPVVVEITTEDKVERMIITETTTFDAEGIMSIVVDPDMNSKDVYRFNNYFPMRFVITPFQESKYSIYDALYVNPQFSAEIDFKNIEKSSIFSALQLSQYPYWSIVLGSNISAEKIEDTRFLFGFDYKPNPWINLNSKWLYKEYINAKIDLSLPQLVDLGFSSPFFTSKYYASFFGEYIDNFNYSLGTSITANDLYQIGSYSNVSYNHIKDSGNHINTLIIDSTYLFNVKSFIQPHLSLNINYSDKDYFKPLDKNIYASFIEDDETTDKFFDYFQNKADLIVGANIGFSTSLLSNWRINALNFLSFQGIHVSLEAGYDYIRGSEYVENANLFKGSLIIAPKFYIIGDMALSIPFNISAYYSPDVDEIKYSFGYSFSASLGTSLYNQIK